VNYAKSFFSWRLTNTELAAFALGLVVGAAGAITGSLSYWHSRDVESSNLARAELASARIQQAQFLEMVCLEAASVRPVGAPAPDLPTECSPVLAKLRAAIDTQSPNQRGK
jgi:hypothetical protein